MSFIRINKIENVEIKYKDILINFRKEWIETFGNSINMGTVGFSVNLLVGNEKIRITYILDNRLDLITERHRKKLGISDDIYLIYKKEIEKSQEVFDKYLISGKQEIYFKDINPESLKNILNATILFTKELSKEKRK